MPPNEDAFGRTEPVSIDSDLAHAEAMLRTNEDFTSSIDESKNHQHFDEEKNNTTLNAEKTESFFSRKSPVGIPYGALIAIGMLFIFILVAVYVVFSKDKTPARPVADQNTEQTRLHENQIVIELGNLKDQLSRLQSIVDRKSIENKDLLSNMEKNIANLDVSVFEARLQIVEKGFDASSAAIQALNKKIDNGKPLSDSFVVNRSARILSIGNGVARVRDEYGEEFPLQKGDRWDGAYVTAVRGDQRRIILSNGTVIE